MNTTHHLSDVMCYWSLWNKYLLIDETRMNTFLVSLPRSCMYGSIQVLEGADELRMMPLLS